MPGHVTVMSAEWQPVVGGYNTDVPEVDERRKGLWEMDYGNSPCPLPHASIPYTMYFSGWLKREKKNSEIPLERHS